jgi:regulator of sigma E protease
VKDNYDAFSAILAKNTGVATTFTIQRGDETFDATLTPKLDAASNRYMIGITVGYRYQRVSLFPALGQAITWTYTMVGEMLVFISGLFRGKGTGDVAGIVGAVTMVASSGENYGMAAFLTMVSNLSINLGVMNLLPLPALDGGKLLLMGVEKLRGKPLPPEKEGVMNMVGLALFFLLFIVLTFRDVGRIVVGG